MRLFWEITKKSYQRFLSYRAATVAGLLTNFFFGLLRATILIALYGAKQEIAGISLRGAITYAALTQAMIGFLSLFGWVDLMNTVYTGQIATDLLKPIGYFRYWLAQDLGRAGVNFFFRGVIVIIGYALIFDLDWPHTLTQWFAFTLSLVFSWLISFSWRFITNLSAFWTPNAYGFSRFFFIFSWFFSGFLMPLRYYPDWVVRISYLTPFPHMLNTVIEIYLNLIQGPDLIKAILYQFSWIFALILIGQIILRKGLRRLVILGG